MYRFWTKLLTCLLVLLKENQKFSKKKKKEHQQVKTCLQIRKRKLLNLKSNQQTDQKPRFKTKKK